MAPPAPVATRLLGIGAALGLVCAAIGLMRPEAVGPGALPEGAAATVNGVVLRLEAYERAVAALASDRREPLGDSERRHVLDRLLEEELLVQRGLELGLARHDRRVRGDIVSSLIQAVVAQTEGYEPGQEEIVAFYGDNRAYFARTGRLRVRPILVRGEPRRTDAEARARAEEAVARLRAGEPIDAVDAALGDPQVATVPDGLLPLTKLRTYLGPTVTEAALGIEPGTTGDPVGSPAGWYVLHVREREPAVTPPLSEISVEVSAEIRRRAGDRALREYLDELRESADVRIAPSLP